MLTANWQLLILCYIGLLFWKLILWASWLKLNVCKAGLAKKREILIFPRTAENTGIYQEILGNKIDSQFANIMVQETSKLIFMFCMYGQNCI